MTSWTFSIGPYVGNFVDLVIIMLCFLAAVVGTVRGFALVFSLRVGLLVGFVVAILFAQLGADYLQSSFDLPLLWSTVISFIIFFTAGYLLMMIVGTLLDRTLEAFKLEWLDRLLGFFLGIVQIMVVLTLIVSLLDVQKVIDLSDYTDQSFLVTTVMRPYGRALFDWIKRLG